VTDITADATDAIEETALGELLAAPRGGDPADADALAAVLERVGRLAAEVDAVAELDLNPVIVREDGAAVVDVLVRTR
jgi:acetyltransferase